ncbi:MAG: hypothetical protein AAF799_31715 [Myxococcota bacterium]
MFAVALLLMACPGSSDDDTTTAVADGTGSPSTGPDQPATGTVDSTGSGAPATSESGGATTTEADTGTTGDEMCTDETCTSLLTMTFSHDLALLDGPHPLDIQTPLHDLICSIDPAPEGQKSCFGFMFTDLSWDEQTITVEMTGPFFDTDLNPEATPFESVAVQLRLEDQTLYDEVLPVVSGDPIQPDPCGQVCWHATVDATIE